MNDLYGLMAPDAAPIPLMGVKIEGKIVGRGAKVKVSQRFKNQETHAIEAVYKYPLPEYAFDVPYGLTLSLDIHQDNLIKISSPRS